MTTDDAPAPDPSAPAPAAPLPPSIAERRRLAAAAAVDRFLADLRFALEDVPHTIVVGSAVATRVRVADQQADRCALRVDIAVAAPDRSACDAALRGAGYRPAEPEGDVALMRIAGRHGRRPVHVLTDTSVDPKDGRDDAGDANDGGDADRAGRARRRRHPGSPEAVRDRAERLAAAWLPVLATWRVTAQHVDEEGTVDETREVHIVPPSPATDRSSGA